MLTKLTALKPHRYKARALVFGDKYEATAAHARVLTAIGKAEIDTSKPERKKKEPSGESRFSDEGVYKRRDMQAED